MKNIVIIGTGLIGCSLALALKEHNIANNIAGIDISLEHLKQALELNIINAYAQYDDFNNIEPLLQTADWIVLCIPVGAMPDAFKKISRCVNASALISDVGSTKQDVIVAAKNYLNNGQIKRFIPLHPIAGSENHGPKAASSSLFQNKSVIITPLELNSDTDVKKIQQIWEKIGSCVVYMDSQQHDDIFGMVSHLPHVLAFALMQYVLDTPNSDNYLELAGTGFKDFTRIAASSNIMWKDICMANKQSILQHLNGYIHTLQKLYITIEQEQENKLSEIFLQSAIARRKLKKL